LNAEEKQVLGNCFAIDQTLEPVAMLQSAGVIHQGAAGYVMMCARAGVPQVVTPFLVDHYFWADRVSALKLGPEPVDKIDAKTVSASVQQAIEMKDQVKNFAQQSRKNGITEACEVIESVELT
jgi:sterol 3beta-glucosyltransferase